MSDMADELYTDADPMVHHPSHYNQGKFETIDIIEDVIQFYDDPVLASQIWQVLRYCCRAPLKGNLKQDLNKALWYLQRATASLESDRGTD